MCCLTVLAAVAVTVAPAAVVVAVLARAMAVAHVAVQHKQVDEVHRAARQRQEEHHCAQNVRINHADLM